MIRGETIYYRDEDAPTFKKGTFLEEMSDRDACGNVYSKILNENDRIEVLKNKFVFRAKDIKGK